MSTHSNGTAIFSLPCLSDLRYYLPYFRATIYPTRGDSLIKILNRFLNSDFGGGYALRRKAPKEELPLDATINVKTSDILERENECCEILKLTIFLYPFRPEIAGSTSWSGLYVIGDPDDELNKYLVFRFAQSFLEWMVSKENIAHEVFISKMRAEKEQLVSSNASREKYPLVTVCV